MNYGFIDLNEIARVGVIKSNKLIYYKEYNPEIIPIGSIIRARIVKKLPWLESYEVQIEGGTALMPFKHKLETNSVDQILVQVINEPFNNKKARVSEKILIKGKYVIVDPYSKSINISRKITAADIIDTLKKSIEEYGPKFGIIVRTEAEGVNIENVLKELKQLEMRTDMIMREINFLPTPKIVYWQKPDYYNEIKEHIDGLDRLIVNAHSIFDELKNNQELLGKIVLSGEYSAIEDRVVQFELGKKVNRKILTKSGAEIVIDELEALTVIDVNSSSNTTGLSKVENAVKVNLDVIDEIMYQLMIRGIGGIVLIDFIRMKKDDYGKIVKALREAALKYKINLKFISVTKSGLYEVVVNRYHSTT